MSATARDFIEFMERSTTCRAERTFGRFTWRCIRFTHVGDAHYFRARKEEAVV